MHFCISQLLLHNEQSQKTQWCKHYLSQVWGLAGVTCVCWAQPVVLHQAIGLADLGWGGSPWGQAEGAAAAGRALLRAMLEEQGGKSGAASTLEDSTCIPSANIVQPHKATAVKFHSKQCGHSKG